MSTYEANWEAGLLVTAEAVRGIGFAMDFEWDNDHPVFATAVQQ